MRKTLRLLMLVLLVGALQPNTTQAQTSMFHCISPYSDSLWTVDTMTWMVTQRMAITIPGSTYTGGNGLATDQCGNVYIMAKISGVTGRMLCLLDPATAVLTPIGNTGDNVAGIAIDQNDSLWAQTGDGGTVSEQFHMLNSGTGAITPMGTTTGAGSDGETITYCPDDGMIYRWSGRNTANNFERINPATGNAIDIPITGFDWDETFSATYVGGGWFLTANLDQEFVYIDTAGFAKNPNPVGVGTVMGSYIKGMTWVSMAGMAPVAGFSSVETGMMSTFTDTTTGSNVNSWMWDFGDGNTSTMQNPTHTYTAIGTYTVCLIAMDVCGNSDTTCSAITICPDPTAAFTESSTNLDATFTDGSTGNTISGWLWDFGDGNTSTMQNPTHTYAAPGTYTVCLTVTDACNSDSTCMTVTVTCAAPTASWTESSTLLDVNFTDASTAMNPSWMWDFGDGNTSTMQNPSHTYAAPGTYTVCLTVTDACGTDSSCMAVTVTCPNPVPSFTESAAFLVVDFTDGSTGNNITGWMWDFGDGNTSTMQNPQNTYAAAGTYTVCLTVTDDCGSDSTCSTVSVIADGVDEMGLESFITTWPNPTRGELNVGFEFTEAQDVTVTLFSAIGQQIEVRQLNNITTYNEVMDLSNLANGLYIVELLVGDQKVTRTIDLQK